MINKVVYKVLTITLNSLQRLRLYQSYGDYGLGKG